MADPGINTINPEIRKPEVMTLTDTEQKKYSQSILTEDLLKEGLEFGKTVLIYKGEEQRKAAGAHLRFYQAAHSDWDHQHEGVPNNQRPHAPCMITVVDDNEKNLSAIFFARPLNPNFHEHEKTSNNIINRLNLDIQALGGDFLIPNI